MAKYHDVTNCKNVKEFTHAPNLAAFLNGGNNGRSSLVPPTSSASSQSIVESALKTHANNYESMDRVHTKVASLCTVTFNNACEEAE